MTIHSDPLSLFAEWHDDAVAKGVLRPSAMCLGTSGPAGAPNARMVDLKRVSDGGFIFSTSMQSPKSCEIQANPAVSLTFWWSQVRRQVRVVGVATRVSDEQADELFAGRGRDAQIASWAFAQSVELPRGITRAMLYKKAEDKFGEGPISRPDDWGGYIVTPASVEFLEFDDARAHRRIKYDRVAHSWTVRELQP